MKHSIIRGTLILTLAGFLTRILGFFYKVFLARYMSAETLGLYQLIAPVYGICFTIYASGIQTAISGQVAEAMATDNPKKKPVDILLRGLLCSILVATSLSVLLYTFSNQIATHILSAEIVAPSLRIVCRMFPFCSITACFNGYFYGCRRAAAPAITQLCEQVSRILYVLICTGTIFSSFVLSKTVSLPLAVYGLVLGEIISASVTLLMYVLTVHPKQSTGDHNLSSYATPPVPSEQIVEGATTVHKETSFIILPLLRLAIPLTANHLVLNLLHSYETILLPGLLMRFGTSYENALITLGTLTGMAMPFLFFPMAVTSALSILLLPTIAEANARGNRTLMCLTTRLTIRYTMLLGTICMGLFYLLGPSLCRIFFANETAGHYLQCFAFFCPLMYLSQTANSILNGLSKTGITFRNSVITSSLRLVCVALLLPVLGVNGFFLAFGADILLSVLLSLSSLRQCGMCGYDLKNALLKPLAVTFFLLPFFVRVANFTLTSSGIKGMIMLVTLGLLYVSFFLIVLCLIQYPLKPHTKV